MDAPLDPSISDLLRQSAIGPLLDRSVPDVLRDLGVPPLPQLPPLPPLPDLPPLPVLDLHELAKPLTDLAGSFGTGTFGQGGAPDPVQQLQQVGTVLPQVTQLTSTALQLAQSMWQGAGAAGAATKAAQASADGTEIAAQSGQLATGTALAAGSVFHGNAALTAIIAKFVASVTAAGPFLATPGGQTFLVAMATETISQALAVVAETRAELTAHSVKMVHTGKKIPVTKPPKPVDDKVLSPWTQNPAKHLATPVKKTTSTAQPASTRSQSSNTDPFQIAQQLLSLVQTAGTMAATAAPQLAGSVAPLLNSQPADLAAPVGPAAAPAGGAPALADADLPLAAARTDAPVGMTVAADAAVATELSGTPAGTGPGMMPMSGAPGGLARAATGTETSTAMHEHLISAEHGSDMVGAIDGVSLPVIGSADAVTALPDLGDSPDKALIL